ncbi:hypothetical protein K8R30_03405 [archaeon]|nr:hypothetical protein [archaeon]
MMKRYFFWAFLSVFLLVFIATLFYFTGFLQKNGIDSRDVEYWNYSDGEISGTGEIYLEGNNGTCWLLIHSYVATPLEMRELAFEVHGEFGDSVKVMRLVGHGGVPSDLEDVSFGDLYADVEKEFVFLEESCEEVNVVGSSMGGTLAVYLAENEDLKNLYLVNAYLSIVYEWYYVFYPGFYIEYLGPGLHYSKKGQIARISDPLGRAEHVAYLNMPYYTLKTTEDILAGVRDDAGLVTENVLAQHSVNDPVANVGSVEDFVGAVSSENKEMVLFEDSHHVLLMDYDADFVIENILEFEGKFRLG